MCEKSLRMGLVSELLRVWQLGHQERSCWYWARDPGLVVSEPQQGGMQ